MLYLHFKYQVQLSEQQKKKPHCSLSLVIILQVLLLLSRWTTVDLSPDNLSTSELAIANLFHREMQFFSLDLSP